MNAKKTLVVDERHMRCPRCEGVHDVLAYVPLQRIQDYVAETVPIIKCPSCRWLFAPGERPQL